jgi:hypothetical protein
MGSARHVIECHLTQDTRVQNAFDDVTWRPVSISPYPQDVIRRDLRGGLDVAPDAELVDHARKCLAGGSLRTSARTEIGRRAYLIT